MVCDDDENVGMLGALNRDRAAEYQSNSYTTLNCYCFHIETKQNIKYLIKHHGHCGHFGKRVGCVERIRLPSSQSFYYFQAGKLNVNRYATKKTVTQGKINISEAPAELM